MSFTNSSSLRNYISLDKSCNCYVPHRFVLEPGRSGPKFGQPSLELWRLALNLLFDGSFNWCPDSRLVTWTHRLHNCKKNPGSSEREVPFDRGEACPISQESMISFNYWTHFHQGRGDILGTVDVRSYKMPHRWGQQIVQIVENGGCNEWRASRNMIVEKRTVAG